MKLILRVVASLLRYGAPLGLSVLSFASTALASDRVLIVSSPSMALVQTVSAALTRYNEQSRLAGRPGLEVDVRIMPRGTRFAAFAREVRPSLKGYRAVFATSMALARAIQIEDAAIPIVFHGEADPVWMCLVDSLDKPGRNATGYVDFLAGDDEKMVETLLDAFPALQTLYFGVGASNYYIPACGPNAGAAPAVPPPCVPGLKDPGPALEPMQSTAALVAQSRRRGVRVKFMLFCDAADFRRVGELAAGDPASGFVFPLHGLFWRHAKELVEQVAPTRRPAVFGRLEFAQLGGLMALEPIHDADDSQAVVDMLIQVAEGRSPATVPVQRPRGFRFTVNADTAAQQGLRPSLKVLHRADQILLGAAPR